MPARLEVQDTDKDKMDVENKKRSGGVSGEEGKDRKKGGGGKTGGGNGKSMEGVRKNSEMKALLTIMLKTQLRGEQRMRDLEGALFDTYVGPANCPFLNELTEQTQAYNKKVQGNKNHGLGPPHVYAFLGFLEGLERNHKEAVGGKNIAILTEWKKQLEVAQWEEVAEQVRMFRVSKVYDKEKRWLTMSFEPTLAEQRKAVKGALDQLEWECKHGRAPPSHMERELQAFLEELIK